MGQDSFEPQKKTLTSSQSLRQRITALPKEPTPVNLDKKLLSKATKLKFKPVFF